eukprot:scaffold145692_cov63-Attheya_sp.AAC.3
MSIILILILDDILPLLPEIPFCLLPDLANVGAIFPQEGQILSVSQSSIRERYAMYVCFLLFPFWSLDDVKEDCYNATRIKQRLDGLENNTSIYTDEVSGTSGEASSKSEPSIDLDMGLIDEAQDQDDDTFLFQEEGGSPESISFDIIRKYGMKECGFKLLNLPPCIPLESGFISSNRNFDDTNAHPAHLDVREYISSKHLMQFSFNVDTSRRRPPPHGGSDVVVMSPNGTKQSIEDWGVYYGLDDNQQQGAFEVATSNFVLTYHIDASTV